MNKKSIIALVSIAVLGFIVYGNSLNGPFIWDDEVLVRDNVYIRSYTHLKSVFTKDIAEGSGKNYGFYRPFQMLTYMFDHALWKLNPRGYHLSNILLHILAGLAVFWLVSLLWDDFITSYLASLFFIVHPLHTEAVTYISGRSDSLSLLFMLLSIIFYIKNSSAKNTKFYVLMLLSYVFALLSRENVLVLPLLLLLYHYSFQKKLHKKEFFTISGLALVYITLRFTLFHFLLAHLAVETTLAQRIPGFFAAFFSYLKLIVLPFDLHMEYTDKLFSWQDPKVLAGITMMVAAFVYAFRVRKRDKFNFFCVAWFMITLLPQANLYPINAYMAEHWLYVPSIGFFLIIARELSVLFAAKKGRFIAIPMAIAFLVFYSSLTIRQNHYWNSPVIFYKTILEYSMDSAKTYNNLGERYLRDGQIDKALGAFKKAIDLNPDYAEVYNNLGNVYYASGRFEDAITSFNRAIDKKPAYAKAYYNLGRAYQQIGRDKAARDSYNKALSLNPNYINAYINLGFLYFKSRDYDQAIAALKAAIKVDPGCVSAYNNLGNIYNHLGNTDQAIAAYEKAAKLKPADEKTREGLENIRLWQEEDDTYPRTD
ncbi:MAG: tetratricopeptide repeat protein [Candidatus Omnitrophica bacterium]|nr:tetratricopeptide repeat protein [Candidatus Omnitrophota bacterium]